MVNKLLEGNDELEFRSLKVLSLQKGQETISLVLEGCAISLSIPISRLNKKIEVLKKGVVIQVKGKNGNNDTDLWGIGVIEDIRINNETIFTKVENISINDISVLNEFLRSSGLLAKTIESYLRLVEECNEEGLIIPKELQFIISEYDSGVNNMIEIANKLSLIIEQINILKITSLKKQFGI